MSKFSSLPLLPSIQETLAEKGLTNLTEIQDRTLPSILKGKSVVGVAETGSGKTLAYVLPILQMMKTLENDGEAIKSDAQPRAVVIVPTRELAEQITRVFKPFTHTTRIRVRNAASGTGLDVVKKNIRGPFEVLVSTPGRIVKLIECGMLKLNDVRILVFDEADQMLDQSFLPTAEKIVEACAPQRQMVLFSATVSPKVQQLIQNLFSEAEVIRSQGSHQVVSGLTTKNVKVPNGKRYPLLEKLLDKNVEGGTIIFTNTREQCDKLEQEMKKSGYPSALYRGEMDKVERRKNLKLFRDGKIQFLISTDLASRGLDVEHVGRVINYHLPQQMENYIHRVGRTARAGRQGLVINFVTERDETFINKVDHLKSSPEWPAEPAHLKPVINTDATVKHVSNLNLVIKRRT